ncbi:hypothetical protein [Curtobacterium flaccumfaciens]|uniref:hypothetical protein n=1 Tax=Curtobacterium flaccumfaciens TaxID=2035 RepID=UPI003992ABBB
MELILPGSQGCHVKGCDESDTSMFYGTFVCDWHRVALMNGDPWLPTDQTPPTILMGSDLPPQVIEASVKQEGDSERLVVLHTGRDGAVEDQLLLRMSLATARNIVFLLEHFDERAGEGAAD